MIVEEIIKTKNNDLIKRYSDANKYILQVETGVEYVEAIDITPCQYTYIETDKEIEVEKVI